MGLFIGKINSTATSFTLKNKTLEQDRAAKRDPSSAPVYGVVFDPSGKKINGRRLYDAVGKTFSVPRAYITGSATTTVQTTSNSTTTVLDLGQDDFQNLAPFNISIVGIERSSTTGKLDSSVGVTSSRFHEGYNVVPYSDLSGNPNINAYVRFPKFYYCRPQKWEFLVSPKYLPGFLPSPMHYRDGVMYNYAYVSRYALSNIITSGTNNHKSMITATAKAAIINPNIEADNTTSVYAFAGNYFLRKSNGVLACHTDSHVLNTIVNNRYNTNYQYSAFPLDYQSVCMIYFLMYIKYATMAIPSLDPMSWKIYNDNAPITINTKGKPVIPDIPNSAIATVKGNIPVSVKKCFNSFTNKKAKYDSIMYYYGARWAYDKTKTSATYDTHVENKDKPAETSLFETFGLVGFLGERLYIPGIFVKDNRLKIFNLERYYESNRPTAESKNSQGLENENIQSDSWNNYEIDLGPTEQFPTNTSKEIRNIGFSKNTPWAIYPVEGDTEFDDDKFYAGAADLDNPTTNRCQAHKTVDWTENSYNGMVLLGELPNITSQDYGQLHSASDNKVTMTEALVRGYLLGN